MVSALTSANTLNITDVLDGGAGVDTLTVNVDSGFTGFSTGSMKNIENVALNNTSSIARTFDATGITGATTYKIDASKASVSLTGLAATVAVEVSKQASGTFSTAFATAATEVAGTADAMSLKLTAVGTADDAATTATNEESAVAITLNNIETANVATTGTNVLSFGGSTLKTLNISGDGAVKVTAVPTSLTGFDASTATGKITVDLTGTTAQLSKIATGSADDAVTLDSADAPANATLSGGAGADKLTLNSVAKTVQYTQTGFETLALNTVTGALVYSGANTTDLTTVSSVAATAAAVSLVSMGAKDLTFVSTGATVDAGDVSSDHTGMTTLNYAASAASVTAKTAQAPAADYDFSGSTSSLTVNVGTYTDTTGSSITAAKATSLALNVASGKDSASTPAEVTQFNNTITVAKATSIVVDATGKLGAAAGITAAAATGATIKNGSTNGALNLTAAALENLSVKSGSVLDLSASTLTGLQTLTVEADAGLTTLGALAKISSINASGAGTTATKLSQVTLGNLGGANDYNMTLTATGLKGGLTALNINVNTGYNVNATVSGVTGNVSLGTIGATTTGADVTVAALAVGGTLGLGNIKGTGTVSVKADGTVGAVSLGTVQGNNVTVDVSDTIGGVTYGAFTAKTTAALDLSTLQANTVSLTADTASTTLTATINGGILVDAITVAGVTTTTAITLSGDLGLATDTVAVTSNSTAANSSISISGVTNYETATIAGATGNKQTITGGTGADTINGGSDFDTISGGAGADIIDGAAGADNITGGEGADTITMGAGNDTVVLTETTAAIDKVVFAAVADTDTAAQGQTKVGINAITGFGSNDTLNIAGLGDGTTTATGLVNVNAAAALGAFTDDAVHLITISGTGAGALTTGSTTVLAAADLTAATLTNLAAYLGERFTVADAAVEGVIVLNIGTTTSYVYQVSGDATAGAMGAADIALVGTITQGAALTAANLVYA